MAFNNTRSPLDPFDFDQLESVASKTPETVNNTITERTSAWLFGDEPGNAQSWISSTSSTGLDVPFPGLASYVQKDSVSLSYDRTANLTDYGYDLPKDSELTSDQVSQTSFARASERKRTLTEKGLWYQTDLQVRGSFH